MNIEEQKIEFKLPNGDIVMASWSHRMQDWMYHDGKEWHSLPLEATETGPAKTKISSIPFSIHAPYRVTGPVRTTIN